MNKRFFADESGFTLVESLVALALVVSVLMGSLALLGKLVATQNMAKRVVAAGLAMAEMESFDWLPPNAEETTTRDIQQSGKSWTVQQHVEKIDGTYLVEVIVRLHGRSEILSRFRRRVRVRDDQ